MNQILFFKNNNYKNNNLNINKSNNNKIVFFKIQLFFCSVVSIIVLIYYIYTLYTNNKNENISKRLIDNFNITQIYANNNYNTIKSSNINFYETENSTFTVIGLIEINSININYPILSSVSDALLKIAPCRFYGPMPNETGNLCIAGHNYNSYKFFSKIKNLKNGDIINIYDLSGQKLQYSVYSSFETSYNDLSCTSQNTNGTKEITLITCNNIKNKRRVVKAVAQT